MRMRNAGIPNVGFYASFTVDFELILWPIVLSVIVLQFVYIGTLPDLVQSVEQSQVWPDTFL